MAMRLEKENVRIILGNILDDMEMWVCTKEEAEKQLAYIAGLRDMANAVIDRYWTIGGQVMSRLIDAKRVRYELDIALMESYGKRRVGISDAIEIVTMMPTVDAVEVVHGRWKDAFGGKYENPKYICSVCKNRALYTAVLTQLGNWRDEQDLSNYCPNCGAKMDKNENP